MHMVPVTPDIDLTITGVSTYLTPWGAPALAAMIGHSPDNSSDKHILIAYEWPYVTVPLVGPLGKVQKEKLHLDKFCTDARFAFGAAPFDRYDEGNNPPDFLVQKGDQSVALDLAQLTLEPRRGANALFERVKKAAFACEATTFNNLKGCFVYIDFGLDGKRGHALPFRKSDTEYVDQLIDSLSSFNVDPEKWPADELPRRLPELNQGDSDGEAGFLVAPLASAIPTTPFFSRMAFEMGLAFYTRYGISDAWEEIRRRVRDHDKPEIQELLISAGAPSGHGLSYPSDEIVANLALENAPPDKPLECNHLKAVYVHIWSTGAIWQVFPSIKMLSKGVFKGFGISHQTVKTGNS
ncbi:hypothetical protein [Marinobacter nauticus]|uniref:hypothetical protein n=1 Tax=Marinobacter nauticus TaxID=2743 RepID=UPI001C97B402|nr:hypothetical protein [Marinobacter nauticus]MBY6222860.1 hypothetical protein [Marinobacter nauticus]